MLRVVYQGAELRQEFIRVGQHGVAARKAELAPAHPEVQSEDHSSASFVSVFRARSLADTVAVSAMSAS